jgi:hypothetical protein
MPLQERETFSVQPNHYVNFLVQTELTELLGVKLEFYKQMTLYIFINFKVISNVILYDINQRVCDYGPEDYLPAREGFITLIMEAAGSTEASGAYQTTRYNMSERQEFPNLSLL